jgi:hypothetical protein
MHIDADTPNAADFLKELNSKTRIAENANIATV